jgi:hypothetical protein
VGDPSEIWKCRDNVLDYWLDRRLISGELAWTKKRYLDTLRETVGAYLDVVRADDRAHRRLRTSDVFDRPSNEWAVPHVSEVLSVHSLGTSAGRYDR